MELNYATMFLISFYVNVATIGILLISGAWVFFGIRLRFKRMRLKTNTGLLFLKNKAGNFGLPEIVDLREKTFTKTINKNEKDWILSEEGFRNGTFFGLPFCIMDMDDTLTTAGIYYQENVYDEKKKTPVPTGNITPYKPSYLVDPSLIKQVAINQKLDNFLKKIKQDRTVWAIIVGCAILAGAGALFGYDIINNHIPLINSNLEEIKSLLGAIE